MSKKFKKKHVNSVDASCGGKRDHLEDKVIRTKSQGLLRMDKLCNEAT